jgi:chemotaxis protein MotB
MMAFFLLMWLLGSTTEGRQEGHCRLLQRAAEGGDAGRRLRRGRRSHVIKGGGRT